jgi:Restriction endonuclease S subunits
MNNDGKIVQVKDVTRERFERIDDPSSSEIKCFVGLEQFDAGNLDIKKYAETAGLGSAMKRCFAGDTLIARRNVYLRRASRCNFDALCSGDAIVLRENNSVAPNFLPLVFNSDKFWKYALSNADGTMSKRLSVSHLKSYKFFLPSLENQKMLANLIWKIEDLKMELMSEVQTLNQLVKSQFIEMFGDCTSRSKLGDVCSLHARIGWQGLTKNEHAETGNHLLVTGTDFKEGLVNYPGCKFVSKDRYDQDSKIMIQNGDVLVTKDGSIGKVAIVKNLPSPATLNAGIFVVRTNSKLVLGEYMQYCFMSNEFSNFIESMKRGATIAHLNQEKFIKYQIPLPTILLQKEFISFVNQVDKSKFFCRNCIIMTKYIKRQSTILYRGK